MSDKWLQRLDEALIANTVTPVSNEREASTREVVRLFFGMWLAYRLEMDRELKMTPWQWEMVQYSGTGNWELRPFPFEKLQSVTLSEGAGLPMIEGRISPNGEDTIELHVHIPQHVMNGRQYGMDHILFKGPYDEASEGLMKILPVLMGKWTDSMVLEDPRLFFDWVIGEDLSQENP